MRKTIIFDFDGTIADTFVLVSDILKSLSKEFGYKKPTDSEIELLRTQHPKDVIQKVGISPLKLPFLIYRVKTEMHKQITQVKPIKGIEKALSDLKTEKYSLGIVTSNNEKNVHAFLGKNNIDIFDFIQTGSNIFGKARILNGVLKNHKTQKADTMYVGDEIRDIEAAQKVGIKMISVSWGFNTKEGLEKFYPDALITKPNQLLSAVTAE